MKAALVFFVPIALMALLAGCTQPVAEVESVNQSEVCKVSDWLPIEVAQRCTPGQKVVFLPSRFGNEQLPVIFAALNCDLRYTVAMTNGGVACIHAPGKIPVEEEEEGEKEPS